MEVNVEFSGGIELLFGGVQRHTLKLPAQQRPWTLKDLIAWIKANILKGSPESFVEGETVGPGILVVINDTEWDEMEGLEFEIQQGDSVLFILAIPGG